MQLFKWNFLIYCPQSISALVFKHTHTHTHWLEGWRGGTNGKNEVMLIQGTVEVFFQLVGGGWGKRKKGIWEWSVEKCPKFQS